MRKEVKAFAKAMERKLSENDRKRHWSGCDLQYLSMRLTQEKNELIKAVRRGDPIEKVLDEAADISNFLMMVVDNYARDPKPLSGISEIKPPIET